MMPEEMYCPRCGKQFIPETSYCRTCGLSLDGVSEIVVGEASTAPEVKSRPNGRTMRIGIGLFIFGTGLGLANVIIRDLGLFPEIYGKMAFLTFIIAGVMTIGFSFVFPKKRYTKKRRSVEHQTSKNNLDLGTEKLGELPSADRNIDDLMSPASVTERTTRNLR